MRDHCFNLILLITFLLCLFFVDAQVSVCIDDLVETIEFSVISTPLYSPWCKICGVPQYSCSNNDNNINNDKNNDRFVSFSSVLPQHLVSAKMLFSSWTFRYAIHPSTTQTDKENLVASLRFHPQLLNKTSLNNWETFTNNNFTLDLSSTSPSSSSFCGSCTNWDPESNFNVDSFDIEEQKEMAMILQDAQRVGATVTTHSISGNGGICSVGASLKICRVLEDEFGSEIKVDASMSPSVLEISNFGDKQWVVDTSGPVSIGVNFTNDGPDPIPDPITEVLIPIELWMDSIDFSIIYNDGQDVSTEHLTAKIVDNREDIPKIQGEDGPRVDQDPGDGLYNVSCEVTNYYGRYFSWRIDCNFVNNDGTDKFEIPANAVLSVDVSSERPIPEGDFAQVSGSIESGDDMWTPVRKSSERSFARVVEFIRQDRIVANMSIDFETLAFTENSQVPVDQTASQSWRIPSFKENDISTIILRNTFHNMGPDSFGQPVLSMTMPAVLILDHIDLYNNETNFSLSIFDQRIWLPCPSSNANQDDEGESNSCGVIQLKDTSSDHDAFCVLKDAEIASTDSKPISFRQWNISCYMEQEQGIPANSSLIMDVVASNVIATAGKGDISIKLWPRFLYWVDENNDSLPPLLENSGLDVAPVPSNEIPFMNRDVQSVCEAQSGSSLFTIQQSKTPSSPPASPAFNDGHNGRDILMIGVYLSKEQWPAAPNPEYNRSLSLVLYPTLSSYPSSPIPITNFVPQDMISQAQTTSVSLLQVSIDLTRYSDVTIDGDTSAAITISPVYSQDQYPFMIPFRLFSLLSGSYILQTSSFTVKGSAIAPIAYFEKTIGMRQNQDENRDLILTVSNFNEISQVQMLVFQQDEFPNTFFTQGQEVTSLTFGEQMTINIDDEKAESEGKSNIVFIGGVLMEECFAWDCSLIIDSEIDVYQPPQRSIVQFDDAKAENNPIVSLSYSSPSASTLENSFQLKISRSIFDSISEDDIPYTVFTLGVDVDTNLAALSKKKSYFTRKYYNNNNIDNYNNNRHRNYYQEKHTDKTADTMSTNLSLSLREPVDYDRVVWSIGSASFSFFPQASLTISAGDMKEAVSYAEANGQVILVLDIRHTPISSSTTETSAEIILEKHHSTLISFNESTSSFRKTIVEPNIGSLLEWQSYRIKLPSLQSIVSLNGTATSNEDDTIMCFSLGEIKTNDITNVSSCLPVHDIQRDLFINQDTIHILPTPDNLTRFDLNTFPIIRNSEDSRQIPEGSLVISTFWRPPTQIPSIEQYRQSLELFFKPPLSIDFDQEPKLLQVDRNFNQSFLLAADLSHLDSNSSNSTQNNTDDFYMEFRYFEESSTSTSGSRSDVLLDERCFLTTDSNSLLRHKCRYINATQMRSDVYNFQVRGEKSLNIYNSSTIYLWLSLKLGNRNQDGQFYATSVYSDERFSQIKSIPMFLPQKAKIIVPSLFYPLSLLIGGILFFLMIRNREKIFNNVMSQKRKYYSRCCILFIAFLIAIAVAIIFASLTAVNDCWTSNSCCTFGSYSQQAQEHSSSFHRFQDQPLAENHLMNRNNDNSINNNNNSNTKHSNDTLLMSMNTADCFLDSNDATLKSFCIAGEHYNVCARGAGVMPIVAMAFHALSFIPLCMCCACCYLRLKYRQKAA